ncbi:HlyD family secretion protein [Pararhodobacter sp.]|uniref:HlyD family secretion protein n=1 Tax=Pararhodobacter sp. TaxID=2127056 RepID=UPI002B002AC4|nr:HlyD family secretion protein [Pararhodobacter sp.]
MSPKDTATAFDPTTAPAAAAKPKPKRSRRRVLMLTVPLALAVAGGFVWLTGGRYESTDNAYVRQAILPVSADVAGRITEVAVQENQHVEAGAVLFRLDDEPYRIALDQAEAALASARLAAEQQRSAWVTADGRLDAARQVLDLRERDYQRQTELSDRGVITHAALDSASITVQAAENDVRLAALAVTQAAAALGGDPTRETDSLPSVRAALSAREAAQRALDHTVITAPASGIVSQTGSLNVGQYVATGTMVASLVESDASWIEANFKETQLGALVPGQPVSVEIDAYSGAELHGVVDSIGAATGSQFSLIPAQNATGNWVKVVQRVPVRIRLEGAPEQSLRGGLSASVSVDTGTSRLDRLDLSHWRRWLP